MLKCSISKKCGSCQYINDDYQQQLLHKQQYCQKLFSDFHVNVHPVVGMEQPYGYRNKVIVAFNQAYEYGLYEESSHRIVPMKQCLLHDDETHHILSTLQRLFRKYRMSIYDEKRGRGFLRHVLIRRAITTNQSLVTLVVNEPMMKGSKNFCQELIKACPSVKTVVLNVNKRKTSVVLGNEEKVLYGKGFIVDELCGLTFTISSKSFYQINHEQCEKLYQKVSDLLLDNCQSVLDTYCGIGTIGMVLSKKVKNVLGVELNKTAYMNAMNNAKMNHISHIRFINQDATEFMKTTQVKDVDCIIMDPPRSGSTKEFIQGIQHLSPKQVIYVSCDPHTQVRDLKWLKEIGYTFHDVYLYDMFPHTKGIESVVSLIKK